MQQKFTKRQKHIPVLASEVVELLKPEPGDHYLDLTAGYGGHASLILDKVGDNGSITLVDRDREAIDSLKKSFMGKKNVEILHNDFLTASKSLLEQGKKFDLILADLGVSSVHLNNYERGFSFRSPGPLDMRMDRSKGITAADVINTSSVADLADILRRYGEIRGANKLAKILVENRPYNTTGELSELISKVIRARTRLHPATKVFQALRIVVNDELSQLEKSLPIWVDLLDKKGRIGVISFHSLEDRLVKQAFSDFGGNRYDAKLQIVTGRPITSSDQEVVFNPRARSAKLRVAQRK